MRGKIRLGFDCEVRALNSRNDNVFQVVVDAGNLLKTTWY